MDRSPRCAGRTAGRDPTATRGQATPSTTSSRRSRHCRRSWWSIPTRTHLETTGSATAPPAWRCMPRMDVGSSASRSGSATRRGPASTSAARGNPRRCSSAPARRASSKTCARPRPDLDNPTVNARNRAGPHPMEDSMQVKIPPIRLCAAALIAWLLVPGTEARAASDDQPWTLDANNWQEGKDLLPEPVLKRLQKGEYWFKVVPIDRDKFHHNYSKAFWDATEANEGKYDLDPKTCGIKDKASGKLPDFVFGLPFPKVDKNAPQAGCKIAQNFNFAGAQGGGGGATFTLNGVDTNGEFRRIKAFIHSQGFQGRHFGPIKDNPENLFGQGIGGAIEPLDVEGVST